MKAVANYYVQKFRDDHSTLGTKIEIEDTDNRIFIKIQSRGVLVDESFKNEDEDDQLDPINLLDIADSMPATSIENETPKKPFRPVYLTSNAITLSDKIQLIIRFYGSPEEIHKNYDYVHVMNYWKSVNNELYLNPDALESILSKELKYNGSLYPVSSIIRMRKYIKRGWNINAGQILKMAFQISELDLSKIDVLEDQLMGVDTTYFKILIDALRTKKESDPDFIPTTEYVTSIIDRIF